MNAIRFGKLTTILTAGFLLVQSVCEATPLNLVLNLSPDIFSDGIDISYNAMASQLSANGYAELLTSGPAFDSPAFGSFGLVANIDNAGVFTSGILTILGTIGGAGSGTLLTGNLNAFGFFANPGGPMEFLFSVTGGDLAPLFGSQGGIILSLGNNSSFTGSFSGDFDNFGGMPGMGMGYSDTASVPEAGSTILLLGLGVVLLGFMQRSTTLEESGCDLI